MTKHNSENERIKRKYFAFLKEAKRLSVQSVDGVASALSRYEGYTKYKDFRTFNADQVAAFKKHHMGQKSQRSKESLSKATLRATFNQLKQFFQWLSREPGYKTRIQYSDAEYFNLSRNDTHIATAKREQVWPTLEQIKHTLNLMPGDTEIERRNRALFAFAILTGARDSAIASMKMKHINISQGCVYQDARDVKTKFRKTFTTDFFPVGDEIREIVENWVAYLQTEKLCGVDDPLFPKTQLAVGASQQFETAGLMREHWSTATPIRTIFKEAFSRAGLPYFNPHSFRHTLVQLSYSKCRTTEQSKAWSQNLGHDSMLTTLTSYGEVSRQRQAEILQGMSNPQQCGQPAQNELADTIVQQLLKHGISLPANSVT